MKHIYVLLFFIGSFCCLSAQDCSTIYFNYGPTGHRIHRQHQTCLPFGDTAMTLVSNTALNINQSIKGSPSSSSNTASSQPAQPTATVYPNPVKDKLTIQLPMAGFNVKSDITVSAVIKLYDRIGNEVYSATTTSNNFLIDMSGFKAGLYSLIIDCGSYHSQFTIVKD